MVNFHLRERDGVEAWAFWCCAVREHNSLFYGNATKRSLAALGFLEQKNVKFKKFQERSERFKIFEKLQEVQKDSERFENMQKNLKTFGRIQEYSGKNQADLGKFKEVQESSEKSFPHS